MNKPADGIGGYFDAFAAALTALDGIFEAEGPWAKRHNLINHVLNESLHRLRGSFGVGHTWPVARPVPRKPFGAKDKLARR